MSYWDTSALAKLYISEADSADFELLAAAATRMVVSETGRLELRTVLRRREAEGSLAPGSTNRLYAAFTSAVATGRYMEQAVTSELETEFAAILDSCLGQNPPIYVRTNDALHLAAARCAGETRFVTTDKGLRKAAQFLGFILAPP